MAWCQSVTTGRQHPPHGWGQLLSPQLLAPWASTTSRTAGAGSCAGRRTANGTFAASPMRRRGSSPRPSERLGGGHRGAPAAKETASTRTRRRTAFGTGSCSARPTARCRRVGAFTSRRAAAAARRRLIEAIERGEVKPARETFDEFWARYLEERKPYLSSGTLVDYETHGRKRLLPTFGSMPLVRIDEAAVRRWMRPLTAETEAAGLSRKTVNNARTILTVALNEAVRQGLIPPQSVPRRAGPAGRAPRARIPPYARDPPPTWMRAPTITGCWPSCSSAVGFGSRRRSRSASATSISSMG
jgi:hypothetical protein